MDYSKKLRTENDRHRNTIKVSAGNIPDWVNSDEPKSVTFSKSPAWSNMWHVCLDNFKAERLITSVLDVDSRKSLFQGKREFWMWGPSNKLLSAALYTLYWILIVWCVRNIDRIADATFCHSSLLGNNDCHEFNCQSGQVMSPHHSYQMSQRIAP